MRRGGARWGPGARDLVPVGVHTPAEAGAAVTLQREEVALLATLRDVEPGPQVGVLGLGKALLQFTGFQPRAGVRSALESIPQVTRSAVAGEGAWAVVAGCCGVAAALGALIDIRALVPIAGIPRQAGAAEGAVSMVDASCLVSRCTGMSAILTGVGRRGNQDTGVLVLSKCITTPALTPVAPRQVDAHGVGTTAMEASCTLVHICTAPSVSLVPRCTLAGVVCPWPWMAPCCCVTHMASIIARIH